MQNAEYSYFGGLPKIMLEKVLFNESSSRSMMVLQTSRI